MSRFMQLLGVELDPVSVKEKAVSGLGGFLALLVVIAISQDVLGLNGASMLIASMGASAVLLFAVPHGQLSQPWPVIGGHVVSAFIGVAAARGIHSTTLAAAVAVGGAIFVMHVLKCIHPPGGATALTAVIGSKAVHDLGYGFVLRPVMSNAVTIVLVAVAFNWLFPWRRYPAVLAPTHHERTPDEPTHEEVLAALRQIDSFVDVNEDDLVRLVQLLNTKR